MSLKKIKTKEVKKLIERYEREESIALDELLEFKRQSKYTKAFGKEKEYMVYGQIVQDLEILIHDPRDTPDF